VWKSSRLRLGKVVGEAVAAELSRHVLDQRDEVITLFAAGQEATIWWYNR
jgi:hypothetical protein